MAMKVPKKPPRRRSDRDPDSRPLRSWDDIRIFLAIHRAGSLSAAAGPLGVTQPTCGRRLAALERALGLRLFDRTPDGLSITTEGTTLLEAATAMEDKAHELALRVSATDAKFDGVVRIATTELFALAFLSGAVPEVRARYPGIRIELVISDEPTDLLRREADFAIRFGPSGYRPTPDTLIAQKVTTQPFALYAAESYLERRGAPADPNVLAGHDVVVYTRPTYAGRDWFMQAIQGATIALLTPSMAVAATAVARGCGLGFLPRLGAREHASLRRLTGAIASANGWFVVHPDLRRVPRIRAVMDATAALLRADSTLG